MLLASTAYLSATLLVAARTPRTPLEEQLETQGFTPTRAPASLIRDLNRGGATATLVILSDSTRLGNAEREALEMYTSQGGETWIFSAQPENALWMQNPARSHVGSIYAADGTAATIHIDTARARVHNAFALDLVPSQWRPIVFTSPDSFRDVNRNQQLDRGEPSGPFIIAAEQRIGEGRVVIVALADARRPPTELTARLTRDTPTGEAVLLEAIPGGWPEAAHHALRSIHYPAGHAVSAVLLAGCTLILIALAIIRTPSGTPVEDRLRELVAAYENQGDSAPTGGPPS